MMRFFTLFLWFSCVFAQTEFEGLIATAPAMDAYPDASVMVLRDYTRIELLPSGQVVRHYEMLWKTRDSTGQDPKKFFIQSNSDFDTIIIEALFRRLSDGTWIEQNIDTLSGEVLYLKYRIEQKPGTRPSKKNHTGGEILFGGYEPILNKRFVIEAPPPWKIRWDLQNGAPEPAIQEEQNRRIFDWTVDDCPQIVPETNTAGLADLVARVLWTTFGDWEELGIYVSDPFWEKVDISQAATDGFLQITSPELQGIPALNYSAEWVLRNIRNVPPPVREMDYFSRSADFVWKTRRGNPLEKVTLLTALLRAYGFAPIPVLVLYSDAPISYLPALEQFHHMILCVPVNEDTIWLDPSAENYPPGELPYACTYGKGCMLVAGAPLLMDVPKGEAASRGAKTEIRASLSSDGTLSGTILCLPKGDQAAEARHLLKDLSTAAREEYFRDAVRNIGLHANMTRFTVSNLSDLSIPVSVEAGLECPAYTVPENGTILLQLPSSPFAFAESGFEAASPVIRYPQQLPSRRRVTNEVSISIPANYRIAALPPPLILDNPYVFAEMVARSDDTGIKWSTTVEIKADKVPVEDYPIVHQVYEVIHLPKNHLVILEKK